MKLKKCPFCGEAEINISKDPYGKYVIWCDTCSAMMYNDTITKEESAIKA